MAAGLANVSPVAVSSSLTTASIGALVAIRSRSHWWKAKLPFAWIVLRFDRNTSDHFSVQKSANSGRVTSLSMSRSRFFGSASARNARASAAVGSRPQASRYARRTNSESVHSPDGRMVICRSLA